LAISKKISFQKKESKKISPRRVLGKEKVMRINNKKFLRKTATAVLGMALLVGVGVLSAQAFNQSPPIPLFQTTLRGVGPGQIPVAAPSPLPAPVTGVTHYDILISQFQDQILPAGFPKTTLWGYNPLFPLGGKLIQPQKHLGGIIIGTGKDPGDPTDKNIPIQITFQNLLFVNKHIIPVDTTIPGANQAPNRTAVHLHGGLIPWISDGGPFDWWDPYGNHGLSFLNNKVLNPIHLPGAAEYYYPMKQSARFMWYHDHAVGITRLNAYAGVASAMLIRDKFEAGLVANNGLPPYIETSVLGGKTIQELPLVFQDKIFVGPNTQADDPDWFTSLNLQPVTQNVGSLWYAHEYDTTRWEKAPNTLATPNPSNIPEFFGDTMLVNGTVFPETTVEARRYRLRMLNACNARFLNLQLYIADTDKNGNPMDTGGNGIKLNTTGSPFLKLADGTINTNYNPDYGAVLNMPFTNAATGDPSWIQIGTEGGFLSTPAKVPSNVPFLITDQDFLDGSPSLDPSKVNKSLLVAPAERPDLIVDFTGVLKNADGTYKSVILYNDAAAPFPVGDDRNDYFPGYNSQLFDPNNPGGGGNPVNGTTDPGFGPNTRVLMRFKVVAATGADPALNLAGVNFPAHIDPTYPSAPWGTDGSGLPYPVRKLTLNEYHDEFGRLIQILGNQDKANPNAIYGTPYFGTAQYADYPPSGTPASVGSTEENVKAGAIEVWEVYNTTGDVHPMHFHLVNVQLINRELFSGDGLNPLPTGNPIPPAANELGWKETVPMYPGTVTRVIMKWDVAGATIVNKNLNPITVKPTILQKLLGQLPITKGMPPFSPRLKDMGIDGYEYVWHCHILEHEEHDMMHTIAVTP
jgi:spore coat protein A, manganese oxidase